MIWLTSDTHFGHTKILDYCSRPFKDAHEMNKAMTERWNEKVKPQDTVYFLGDFCFGDAWKYIQYLNGNIKFIIGSHDKPIKKFFFKSVIERKYIDSNYKGPQTYENLGPQYEFDIDQDHIVLNHYSMRKWGKSHYGAYHFFGHSHGKLPPLGRSMDVGVDTNQFYPYSWPELKEKLEKEGYELKGKV